MNELQVSDDSGDDLVKLAGPLTVASVSEIRTTLLAGLVEPRELRCDLSGVDACDSAGIQLLCSAAATAALASRRLTLLAPSAAVLAAAARIGVSATAMGLHEPG